VGKCCFTSAGGVEVCVATCPGCCDGSGACQTGTANDACGPAGGTCTDCTAIGQTCVGGVCPGSNAGLAGNWNWTDVGAGTSCGLSGIATFAATAQAMCSANGSTCTGPCLCYTWGLGGWAGTASLLGSNVEIFARLGTGIGSIAATYELSLGGTTLTGFFSRSTNCPTGTTHATKM